MRRILRPEHIADFTVADGIVGKLECATRFHLTCGAKKCAERGTRKSAADADSLDSDFRQFSEIKPNALQTPYDVYGTINRSNQLGNVFFTY